MILRANIPLIMNNKTTTVQDYALIWKVLPIISPLISVIALIVYMQVSIGVIQNDVDTLKGYNQNIGAILTAHTTQLAVNQRDISINHDSVMSNRETLNRIDLKLDELKTIVVRHQATHGN
jgi:hypothetical protein